MISDQPEIARQLHVANVLEGSVRKSGEQVRITVQLIHAANGFQVWSETYDRMLDDVFKIQDEIADEVVKQLRVNRSRLLFVAALILTLPIALLASLPTGRHGAGR